MRNIKHTLIFWLNFVWTWWSFDIIIVICNIFKLLISDLINLIVSKSLHVHLAASINNHTIVFKLLWLQRNLSLFCFYFGFFIPFSLHFHQHQQMRQNNTSKPY